MKGDSTANYTSWGCHAIGPAGAQHLRAGGRRAALDRGRHPEIPGKGAPNWDTRERDTLDVRCETPERQRYLADGVELRNRIEPGEAGRRTGEAQAPPRSGYPAGGDPCWACHDPRRGSERESSHYSSRQNRRPSIVVKERETRQRTASAVESRPDFLGPPPTAAANVGSSFGPTPSAISGRQRLQSPRARPKAAGRLAVEWNVGLDYTARRPNCQSANAFVEPRQTRAPRLRNVPSKTDPRVPSHPPASRASSRPRSAPSTIA